MKQSVLMEIIQEIKDKRPVIKELLCEAILLEMETKMEEAYQQGLKDGKKEAAELSWTQVSKTRSKL